MIETQESMRPWIPKMKKKTAMEEMSNGINRYDL
jgi:hypothetical protein